MNRSIFILHSLPLRKWPKIYKCLKLSWNQITLGTLDHSQTENFFLDQQHFPALGKCSGFQSVEVNAAADPVWSKNSSSLEVSEKINHFNADEFIEKTGLTWQYLIKQATNRWTRWIPSRPEEWRTMREEYLPWLCYCGYPWRGQYQISNRQRHGS